MATRILVIGAGAWGLTLADLLARKDHTVCVWDRNASVLELLRKRRTRGTPPGLEMHESVTYADDLAAAARQAEFLVCAVPSYGARSILKTLRPLYHSNPRPFVSLSKGIEEDTLFLPSQIFSDVVGTRHGDYFAVLAGPSHAEEVCRRVPTSIVSCSGNANLADQVRDLFFLPTFRVYTSTDCRGVELGGALKNVLAIAAGVCDGMGFGDNAKAALITRGIAEIARAAEALGARRETISGLSGLGDLIVTAMSRHSRNRMFGELIATGRSTEEALNEVGAAVEGYRTSRSAHQLAQGIGVEMPLVHAVYRLVHERASIPETLQLLLGRDPRPESY